MGETLSLTTLTAFSWVGSSNVSRNQLFTRRAEVWQHVTEAMHRHPAAA